MGDLWATYYPRRRRFGRYQLFAEKKGAPPIFETFFVPPTSIGKTRLDPRARRAKELQNAGYSITLRQSTQPSETAYVGADLVAMNDLLNNALHKMVARQEKPTWTDLGVEGKTVEYTCRDGTKERHFVVPGHTKTDPKTGKEMPKDYRFDAAMKAFGGNRYDDKQTDTGLAWHFHGGLNEKDQAGLLDSLAHADGRFSVVDSMVQALAQEVAELIESRASGQGRIGRSQAVGEEVVRGYDTDLDRVLTREGKAVAGGLAKNIMARKMFKAITGTEKGWDEYLDEHAEDIGDLGGGDKVKATRKLHRDYMVEVREARIDSGLQPRAYSDAISYMNSMLRNPTAMEHVFGVIRGLASFKYLSRLSSGLVNLTGQVTTAAAAMHADGGIKASRIPDLLVRGNNRYVRYWLWRKWGKGKAPTEDDEWLFGEIARRGYDHAQFNAEAASVLRGSLGRFGQKVLDLHLLVFALTERANRGANIAATYYGLREQHTGPWTQEDRDEALKKAKFVSDKGHGVYSKTNLHALARGTSPFSQTVRAFMVFRTWTHNYLQLLGEYGIKDPSAAAWLILSPAMLAGGTATLATPLFSVLMRAVGSAIPGWDPPDDPEEWLYEQLGEIFGAEPEKLARRGIIGYLTGINVKGSLSIGLADIPTRVEDLLGAPASVLRDVYEGVESLIRGDTLKGLEKLAPALEAAPIKAYREFVEGITTGTNQPRYYGAQQLRPDLYDSFLRAIGFNPTEISEKRETQWRETQISREYSEMRTDLYARMRRLMLERRVGTAEWVDWISDVQAYNARVRRHGYGFVPQITPESARTQALRMVRPPKTERTRAQSMALQTR